MATCRNLLGEQPEERLRVWFHNGEDPLDEINRRLAAICQHYNIPQEELQDQLWVTSGNEFPLRVAKGYTNLEVDAVLVRQISTAISDNQIDLAIFDPFVTLHSVSEVDTGKMDAVVRLFAGIGDENDAAIEIAHHVRKPAAGAAADYDVHDIRGVAAITDAVRAARVLNRMNEKDAEAAGCTEIERLSRFRVDRAKGNYSPAQAATWRQFVSVELVNGDDVGVVAPWNFPGQGEQTPEKAAADQKAEHVFLQLLDKFIARGANVSANAGPTYAPAKFAEEREAKTAKVSKAALKAAMNRLLDAGRIRSEPSGRGSGRSHRLVAVAGVHRNDVDTSWSLRGHMRGNISPIPPIKCYHTTSPSGRHTARFAAAVCRFPCAIRFRLRKSPTNGRPQTGHPETRIALSDSDLFLRPSLAVFAGYVITNHVWR